LQTITITNTGDVPANEITVKLTDVNTSAALHDQLWICTISSGVVYQNEKLSAMEAGGLMSITGTLAPGATDSYTEEFYAGDAANSCGALAQGSPAPASATNPAAASLDNAAQGGTVTPSYTVGYSG
jgi:hypothetical protein